jgi:uroporphyrinogen III methyltransferase / synthase
LPLFGKRIVVTRAREEAQTLGAALEDLGAEVRTLPTIEIRPPASWGPLDRAINHLEDFDFLLVTSVHGVRNFLVRLKACGRDIRDLKGIEIGAIGPATAAEFARTGVRVDFVPRQYRGEGLLEALAGRDLSGKAFLIPRAKVARDLVPKTLTERGARVEVAVAYQTVAPDYQPEDLKRQLTPLPDAITFTSPSTASNFSKLLGKRKLSDALAGVAIVSIGPVTSDAIRKLELDVSIEAKESTVPGLVRALQEYFTVPRR